ncbi:olfactory receptor 5H17-like [Callospermophilus lateralis]|uniref:olfactory receptor 5H17-like n=1 Tax=Callospermophilus lateralis TaxID=76772 RepID=UPI0040388935
MKQANATLLTEFIFTGLTQQPQWKLPLFLVFLMIYLMTLVGNLGLISLIWKVPHLHIPMYFFLGNLAILDTWLSSTVTPNMLVSLLIKSKMISLTECKIQFFSFGISVTTECFLLAAMAYDRYVAICQPLLYPVIMTNRLCFWLLVLSYIGGFLHALIHEVFLFRLIFCNSNVIHHVFCDVIPLLKISCTDPSINYLLIFIFSGSIQVFTIGTILISYTLVLFTILKKKSEKGVRKAFSTCGAHLFSVCLYYGPLLFMYVHPASSQESDQEMIFSLFYTVIIPVLNPVIYSLRNKQVMDALTKILKRNV